MKSLRFGLVALTLAMARTAGAQSIRYVDDSAPGGGNGATWATAWNNLQDAMARARSSSGAIAELRVGQGNYTPDMGGGNTPGSRTASFKMISGVAIRGGYMGYGAPTPDLRKPRDFRSVLSGDLAGNDGSDFRNYGENSYHVVSAKAVKRKGTLDGFFVSGGYAFQQAGQGGGGILIEGGKPRFRDCTVEFNAAGLGAGVLNLDGQPRFDNCDFRENLAWQFRGGAYYGHAGNVSKTSRFTGCSFSGNKAKAFSSGSDGGALYLEYNAYTTLLDCEFEGNSAEAGDLSWGMGGAICNLSYGLNAVNCRFYGNSGNGGGAIWAGGNSVAITGCVFSGNTARWAGACANFFRSTKYANCSFSGNHAEDGGAIGNSYGTVEVRNCVLWGNTATNAPSDYKAQVHNSNGGTASISYSCVQGVFTAEPGEDPPNPADFPGCTEANPLYADSNGPDNIVGTRDDDLRLLAGSPCIDAADNSKVPADTADADHDGNTAERLPVDVVGAVRFGDDPGAPDVGAGTAPIVDMGAYER